MTKFNPKVFAGTDRKWVAVPGATNIYRLWVWEGKQYVNPPRGKRYMAKRWVMVEGKKISKSQSFETLEEAREWAQGIVTAQPIQTPVTMKEVSEPIPVEQGPLFRDVVDSWKAKKFSTLAPPTRVNYEKWFRLHFQKIMDMPIRSITSKVIDDWLDERKKEVGKHFQARRRTSFENELGVFQVIFNFYSDYFEDSEFRNPVKGRHKEDCKIRKPVNSAPKDLTVEEFLMFREHLMQLRNGLSLAALATVQYFQALRVSEVAAIRWEDLKLDWKEPSKSRLLITQHVVYVRKAGLGSYIEAGFKNASAGEPIKEQPLFPESFEAFKVMRTLKPDASGLVFKSAAGSFYSYREIQFSYDRAFKAAKLPYRGTHVMRHGGTRAVYNATGDLAIAQQLLGNANLQSTLVYAKREKSALTSLAQAHWERATKSDVANETFNNFQQSEFSKKKG